MTREELDQHGIIKLTSEIKDYHRVKSEELNEGEELNPDLSIFIKVVRRIIDLIHNVDTLQVSINTINGLNSSLTNAYSNLKAFIQTANNTNKNTYESNLHSINNYIAILEVSMPKNENDIFERISTMRRRLTRIEGEFENTKVEYHKQLEESENKFSKDHETKTTELQKLSDQIEELNKKLVTQENLITQYKTTIATYFAEKEINFTNLFNNMKNEKEKELNEMKVKFEKQYNKNYSDFSNIHQGYVDIAKSKAEEIEKLVNVAGQNGAKAPYVEAANKELKSSRIWRGISLATMLLFVSLSILIAINFNHFFAEETEWYDYVGRFFILTGVATLIAYASKIGAKHTENFRYYRQLSLEFSSIFLFLNSLEDKDINEIKKGLVEKYYANLENPNNRKDDEGINNNTIKQLQSIIEIFQSIKK